MFKPLHASGNVVDACADRLERAVLSGEVAPGVRLPAERVLASSMRVNRVTVRSALARLEGAGLLRVRHGSGYRVQDYRDLGGPGLLPALAASLDDEETLVRLASDVLAMRRQVAGLVLATLASGVSPEHLGGIEEAIGGLEAGVDAGVGSLKLAHLDRAVFRALAGGAGSSVHGLFMNPIFQFLEAFSSLREAVYGDVRVDCRAYRQLVLWLRTERDRKPIHVILEQMAARDAGIVSELGERLAVPSGHQRVA